MSKLSLKSIVKPLGKAAMVAPLALSVLYLSGCDDNDNDDFVMTPPPPPTPAPPPPPPPASFDVKSCVQQEIPGTGGVTVAEAIIPDTLTINLAAPSGFPNGRRLPDPVIDVTLAVIFLDLDTHSPTTLASVPVNPPENDVAFRDMFPYLASAQGSPPLADTGGTTFNFRTDAPGSYTRVDRMGMPAVATALIGSGSKNAYNDGDPADDVDGDFQDEIVSQLTTLTNALADDLDMLGLTPCATPN